MLSEADREQVRSVVSPALAEQAGIRTSRKDRIIGAGGASISSIGALKSLRVGDASLEELPVIVSDIFSPLQRATDASMDGILGYSFLREFKLVIDYPNARLRFQKE